MTARGEDQGQSEEGERADGSRTGPVRAARRSTFSVRAAVPGRPGDELRRPVRLHARVGRVVALRQEHRGGDRRRHERQGSGS
ncbi:hypothetical protein EES46_00350 [Streptomyces sp. ADI98-10]|uniref:hypothetical protein n=1 Tax=Streptomyces anulatus TaxID=1892 RepID=UPI000FA42701|nr:hypothetical protein EES46_00350 [Streptomyces sp. ADI98-10]